MTFAAAELLTSLEESHFGEALEIAREIIAEGNFTIRESPDAVSCAALHEIYSHRAQNPRVPPALATEFAAVAHATRERPSEKWRVVSVAAGPQMLALFVDATGVVRAVLTTLRDARAGELDVP